MEHNETPRYLRIYNARMQIRQWVIALVGDEQRAHGVMQQVDHHIVHLVDACNRELDVVLGAALSVPPVQAVPPLAAQARILSYDASKPEAPQRQASEQPPVAATPRQTEASARAVPPKTQPPQMSPPPPVAPLPPVAPAQRVAPSSPPPARRAPAQPAAPAPRAGRPVIVQLPNASAGKPYSAALAEALRLSAPICDARLRGHERTGLVFDVETALLCGVPEEAGEYYFELSFRFADDHTPGPELRRRIQLTVNPDPKSLWKNLPSDREDPYWKPDAAKALLRPARTMVAASQRGRSHAHEGKFRDDDFVIDYLDDSGWYLLVVADGAGTAAASRRGSQRACAEVRAFVREQVGEFFNPGFMVALGAWNSGAGDEESRRTVSDAAYHLIAGAAHAALMGIKQESAQSGLAEKDFATTLLFVLARPIGNRWFVAAYWVGDGGIGIYRRGQEVRVLGEPDGGEFAGQTRFLTTAEVWAPEEIQRRIRLDVVPDFTAIVLMTDGVSDPKFDTETSLKLPERWDAVWGELEPRLQGDAPDAALLDWLDFWSTGNHDDRTIAVLH